MNDTDADGLIILKICLTEVWSKELYSSQVDEESILWTRELKWGSCKTRKTHRRPEEMSGSQQRYSYKMIVMQKT